MPNPDNANQTSPLWDTFDPTAIAGTSWKPSDSFKSAQVIRGIRAGAAGGALRFRQGSRWDTPPPGSSYADDGSGEFWFNKNFTAYEPLLDVQITEISKTGSTNTDWEILL